jgi:DNA-binding response OmpR family regulator
VKILVVDDDLDLLQLIAFALRQAGYLVVDATDGELALQRFADEAPDLVVLDGNLPKVDGFEVCRRVRATSRVPILMLTVRGDEADVVRGLDLGADDYLTKPFSPRTLLARMRALLRRSGIEKSDAIAAGRIALDVARHEVKVDGGAAVRLTKLEFRLLQLMIAHAGQAIEAERLFQHVWGQRAAGDRQLLKQLVHRLRQKIEGDPAAPRFLRTVPGVGYELDGEGRDTAASVL